MMDGKKFGFFIIKREAFIAERKDDIRNVYEFDRKVLGEGSYGNVFRAKHRQTGEVRAVKVISKAKIKNKDRFKMEIDILKKLDHPNVIKLFQTFEDHKYVYLVMEICTGGELFDRIKEAGCFTEKFAARVFKQILQALFYCHKNKICHRDLKPENFLFENKSPDSTLKVIDFGLSKIYDDPKLGIIKMKTTAGTPYYISPEVIAGNYNEACDLWSAGVIMYILLCGYPPFYGGDDDAIIASVKKGAFTFEEDWDEVSTEAKNLIKNLITKPERRLTAEEALNHPWIKHQAAHSGDKELKVENLKALHNFMGTERLKKAALTLIASQCSSKEIQHLKEVFQAMDQNHDGFLSLYELQSGMNKVMDPKNVKSMMQSIDTDMNGTVNYTEFLAATLEENVYLQEEKLRHAFNKFDRDGSGTISAEELAEVIGNEQGLDRELWINLIREVDENGDGEIDFDEFVHMMRRGN